MKQVPLLASIAIASLLIYSCGSGSQPSSNDAAAGATGDSSMVAQEDKAAGQAAADDSKGKGKFTEVKLTHPLDKAMVAGGKTVYDVKCAACHKLTNEKLVGPGWKDVTDRRKPEWIMNFVTNTDEMIDKDPAAQAMLEQCMVRMPNQHLTDDEARHVLEYMRENDGKN
ncbi:MAG TPA: c-type cytochrome [Chitinophaga sp.]|uniref:c-type cytochrome n=1 Tax=Chitinophaga sp. TaxID=1869181 RepID=UPI002F9581DB